MSGMLIVGITGRSGSGKTSVARHYLACGYPVADGDAISREIYLPGSPCLAALRKAFGDVVVQADGTLDRKQLGRIAFSSPQSNQRLVEITHPYIIEEFLRRARMAAEKGSKLFFADGAMIIGGPFERYCDKIVVVTAPQKAALARIRQRDGITDKEALLRLKAQPPQAVLTDAADYVIRNDADEAALRGRADTVLESLLKDAAMREEKL